MERVRAVGEISEANHPVTWGSFGGGGNPRWRWKSLWAGFSYSRLWGAITSLGALFLAYTHNPWCAKPTSIDLRGSADKSPGILPTRGYIHILIVKLYTSFVNLQLSKKEKQLILKVHHFPGICYVFLLFVL